MLLDMISLGESPTHNSYDMLSSILTILIILRKCRNAIFLVFNKRLCYVMHKHLVLHLFDHFFFKYPYSI